MVGRILLGSSWCYSLPGLVEACWAGGKWLLLSLLDLGKGICQKQVIGGLGKVQRHLAYKG